MLVLRNSDYLALKITTKNNKLNHVEEIKNWKELGLREKSYIRIEIPQDQFLNYYRMMLEIFNLDIIEKIIKNERDTADIIG